MAEAFGVPARAAAVAVSKPKSYFLRDFFTEVVFPDKDVAIRSARVLLRQRIRRLLLTACALAGAAGFLFLPIRSYCSSREFIHEARRFVDRLSASRQGQKVAPLPSAETLESVEAMAKTMAEDSEASVLFSPLCGQPELAHDHRTFARASHFARGYGQGFWACAG